jgi:hypothetical protein
MLAIRAESEAEEIGLPGVAAKAIVGKVAEFIGGKIQDRDGLLFLRGVGAIAAVKEDGETAVRRDRRGGGEIIDGSRVTRNLAEEFSVGQLEGGLTGRPQLCANLDWGAKEKTQETESNKRAQSWHGWIIEGIAKETDEWS